MDGLKNFSFLKKPVQVRIQHSMSILKNASIEVFYEVKDKNHSIKKSSFNLIEIKNVAYKAFKISIYRNSQKLSNQAVKVMSYLLML